MSTLASTGQDASAIGNDPLPEYIPLPLTPLSSPSPGSSIAKVITTQTSIMEIPGEPPAVLEEELVTFPSRGEPNDEHSIVLTRSTDYPTCSECTLSV